MPKHHPLFAIVLHHPEIAGNTGSIGRTCVALDIPLIILGEASFSFDEKQVRRAGLDYWKYVQLRRYATWEEYIQEESLLPEQLWALEPQAEQLIYNGKFTAGCHLHFGSETKGIEAALLKEKFLSSHFVKLPQFSPHIRSLNLANAATAAAYEVLRQLSHYRKN